MPEKHNKRFYFLVIQMMIILLAAGCGNGEGAREGTALIQQTNPPAVDVRSTTYQKDGLPEKVKKEVAGLDGIYDVAVVQNGKKVLVAYKVNHLRRFQMKKIEKDVNSHLKKRFKDNEFIVSSDYKIFLETVRLNEMLLNKDVPKQKAKKKFQEIESLQKEMT
ncbi:YhcN/YlaJ family sporulation lipoprotein [Bacillus sp. V5-8f]|uniref:YhcN/YlaJ family sporulation lipoprotein n=1 Tax=Bacillus sp. V5-8f TaxID=2053044 RepID=UPI000C782B7A|nr:YhcN/YlaJ family sporulation lipoprotein [Bacillus sp. V5-8f]PLT33896.1 sporulation protein [Bacillus sp. V5-8f]